MTTQKLDLEGILDRAEHEVSLTDEELHYLLNLHQPEQLRQLFGAARKLRERYYADKIFLYGFVYFSTYCRNDCNFCLYRQSNQALTRYRKSSEEILSIAQVLAEDGVHLLDLTMGEDPVFQPQFEEGWERLFGIVERVKGLTGLPLMISPGLATESALSRFKQAGIDWYACYQETHNQKLYAQLRVNQSYHTRMAVKDAARRTGLLIEEGLLTGVGESDADIIQSLRVMGLMNADQVRVMSFVPQQNTPLAGIKPASRLRELAIIAVMRLVFPDRLIPASLDVDGLGGLKERLLAGANVVTSIIPPQAGLAGVSQSSLGIADGQRTVSAAAAVMAELGLKAASPSAYAAWVASRQKVRTPAREGIEICG